MQHDNLLIYMLSKVPPITMTADERWQAKYAYGMNLDTRYDDEAYLRMMFPIIEFEVYMKALLQLRLITYVREIRESTDSQKLQYNSSGSGWLVRTDLGEYVLEHAYNAKAVLELTNA